ncbi:MAG TPA: 23S rRNA (guanosine(2251)-2'-O)-methyltransferase RlmB [Pyrinomonadaceae bacterium]|nr:23S rRNA (guanosine(2251)-2'-O)-methyltransferase RlmB [Pyrinomonadaceae bacterium]
MPQKHKREQTRTSEIFGVNPVLEALRAKRRAIREITIAAGSKDVRLAQLIELARAENVPVHYSPRANLDRATGNAVHQGVIARVAAAEYADTDELLDSIGKRVGTNTEPLVLVLDGIEDPHNLGAILRTAECSGVDGVFIPERRAAGLTEAVGKASAGAIEYVPVARATNLSRLIDELKERNVWVVGTAADAPMDYTEWDWTRASAIVMGGEGSGLHRLVREHCDALVRMPVLGRIESLNVSVATGVVLYEALRQRTHK